MNQHIRRLPLSKTYNTRDLGGYPTTSGGATQWGRIYRSDAPLRLGGSDLSLLREREIGLTIDLRTPKQAEAEPSALRETEGICYRNMPFPTGNRNPDFPMDMANIYIELFSCKQTVSEVLRLILAEKGAVMFHCIAGKDRTGVIAALLLLNAGVALSDVLMDYQVSWSCLTPVLPDFRAANPDVPLWMGRSDPEFMEEALTRLFAEYGDVEGYLTSCGLTQAEQIALRDRLTAE